MSSSEGGGSVDKLAPPLPPETFAQAITRGGALGLASVFVSCGWAGWQVSIAINGPPASLVTRSIHLGFAVVIVTLGWMAKNARKRAAATYTIGLAVTSIALGSLVNASTSFVRPDYLRYLTPLPIDHILGWSLLLIVVAAVAYTTGLPLFLTTVLGLTYVILGQFLPDPFGHAGFSLERVLSMFYVQPEGLFGSILGVSATMVYPVVLFGALIFRLGGDTFLRNSAIRALRGVRAPSPKIAILMSGLFSTITGAGPTNVAATGAVTIPAMKKAGYPPAMAAGTEAAASIGGQFTPPIMGAAAFLMADLLMLPYKDIIKAALVPAILYYVGTFMLVHLESIKLQLPESLKDRDFIALEIPSAGRLIRSGWHFVVALALFVYLVAGIQMSVGRSAVLSSFWLVAGSLIVAVGEGLTVGLRARQVLSGVVYAGQQAAAIAVSIGAVELIVSSLGVTGFGIKMSALMVGFAGGSGLLLLALTAVAAIVLGTGLPTTPTYLVLAVLVAPALSAGTGMPLIAAHLFVFYFGVWGDLSPPTAVSPTIAAGIAGSRLIPAMLWSMRLGIMGLIVPFLFAFRPELLGLGTGGQWAGAVAVALLVVGSASVAFTGYFLAPLTPVRRTALGVGALIAIYPSAGATAASVMLIAGALVTPRRPRASITLRRAR